MEEQSLALSFSNSLTTDIASIAGEYAELGLDALVEEGLFKDIPLASTAVYHIAVDFCAADGLRIHFQPLNFFRKVNGGQPHGIIATQLFFCFCFPVHLFTPAFFSAQFMRAGHGV